MEDVAFKVFLEVENEKPVVRRFAIKKHLQIPFFGLAAKLQDVYPELQGKIYSVMWIDEDGDHVTISTDEELSIAITEMGNPVKLHVQVKKDRDLRDNGCDILFATVTTPNAMPKNPTHYGVVCDGCDSAVIGFRYKCTTCEDFDLCSRCESAGKHPEHCMVRVPAPSLPHMVIKEAIKRSRHFLKSVPVSEECTYKRNRRDRSREKHRHGDHHRDHHRGEHPRRPRNSWLETFATYMNEFANLAGDVNIDIPKKPEQKTENQTPTKQSETQTKQPETQPKQPETENAGPSTSQNQSDQTRAEPTSTECPFFPVNVENFQKMLEGYLKSQANLHFQPPFVPTTNTDVEMTQTEKSPEPDQVSVQSASSSSSEKTSLSKEATPDKVADEWTLINKERDLMDLQPNPAPEGVTPSVFTLPEEFQERVTISGGQNLYPPLNMATAVLKPKEPEGACAPQPSAPSAPQTPQAPQPPQHPKAPETPKPQPRQRHPQAHIDAAIEQMLFMGFTNEGGWLTQLLESKDGNIAAVLDLLTPITPKK